jgi:hypothetical protein
MFLLALLAEQSVLSEEPSPNKGCRSQDKPKRVSRQSSPQISRIPQQQLPQKVHAA